MKICVPLAAPDRLKGASSNFDAAGACKYIYGIYRVYIEGIYRVVPDLPLSL